MAPVPAGVAGMLDSPRLSAAADVRAWLAGGGLDPRVASVLDSVLAHHSVGIANAASFSAPVHVQSLDIVSVDGQAVGPANFAARDLVTELAALDPSVRPDEIGTPWPIQSPGFFSDQSSGASLHLAFEMPGTDSPSVAAYPGDVSAGAAPPGSGSAAAPAPSQPAAVADVSGQPVPQAPAGGATPSAYVDPLPKDVVVGRTDMGVDVNLKPGEPIVAPGTSRVLGIMQNWYSGQPYVGLQFLDGPMKGHNYYVAEQIDIAVSPGQVVRQGQPIGHYASSGTGIEMGWAGSDWQQTLAQSQGNTGDSSHGDAPAGVSFHSWLVSLSKAPPPSNPAAAALAAVPSPTAAAGSAAAPAASAIPAAGAPSATPAQPAFNAIGHQGGHRRTVQFLPAVEGAPGSSAAAAPPPAPAAPQVVPGVAGGTPAVAGTPAPAGAAPASSLPGQVANQVASPVAGQGPGVAPVSAGAMTVRSSRLTPGQETFTAHLSQLTGLSPRVIAAWALAEESGGAAQQRQAQSNFNWLNIGYFDSGAGQMAFDKTFGDPVSAAEQTAKFLKGEWGGASPLIRAILSSVNKSPDEQMSAIANSDWASSHYGGGANLHGTYQELGDLKVQGVAANQSASPGALAVGAAGAASVPVPVAGAPAAGVQAAGVQVAGVQVAGDQVAGVAGAAPVPAAGAPPAPPAAPAQPAFNAIGHQGGHRRTVQFLPAVQGAPDSLAAAQPPTPAVPAAGGGAVPAVGAPAVAGVPGPAAAAPVSSLPAQGAPQGAPVDSPVAGQGPGVTPGTTLTAKLLRMAQMVVGAPYNQGNFAAAIDHGAGFIKSGGVDCSGFVSWLMGPQGLGIWNHAYATPNIPNAPGLQQGQGNHITIWNNDQPGNAGHVFIQFADRYFASEGGVGVRQLPASEVQMYLTQGSDGGHYVPFHPKGL